MVTSLDPADEAVETGEEAVVVPLGAVEPDPGPTPEDAPVRALVVCAHPDDVDFGASGTVATWTDAGCEVTYCIVTDGAAGAADPEVDLAHLVEIRQREQRAAAHEVGVEEVVFLGFPDGRLEPTLDVRREIARVIRAVRPERLITQSPERNYSRIRASHPDHLAAGEAALRAVYPDARNPYAFPELVDGGLEPFEVPEVWLMASPTGGRAVDITDAFSRKLAALRSHASQITEPERVGQFVREWGEQTAKLFGLGPGRLAESFQVVDTR